MSYEEVIEELEDNMRACDESNIELTEFLEMLIKACEKQIVLEPEQIIPADSKRKQVLRCKLCGTVLATNFKGDYCEFCGQKIKSEGVN